MKENDYDEQVNVPQEEPSQLARKDESDVSYVQDGEADLFHLQENDFGYSEDDVEQEIEGKRLYRPRRLSEEKSIANRLVSEIFEWLSTIVSSLVMVSLIFTFVVRVIGVSGPSMQSTLFTDQRVLISGLFYTPKNGDVVVFTKKNIHLDLGSGEKDEPLIKRVIATEGQVVDIDFVAGEVRVDGKLLDEPYIDEPTWLHDVVSVSFPYTVPPGTVFVMGDNRNHSSDSRRIGPIDTRYILGRVLLRVWPLSEFGPLRGGGYAS